MATSRRTTAAALALAALAAVPTPGRAQDGFLFEAPAVTIEARAGRTMYAADSDVHRFVTRELTLEKGDFAAISVGADIAFRALPALDIVIGAGYTRSEAASESRDFVGEDDLPIQQVTRTTAVPLTAGVRLYPLKRGEAIGNHAWIPASFTPYIGGGIGATHYGFRQDGDFVDRSDLSIVRDRFESKGTAFAMYGEAGASWWVTSRIGLSALARYSFSSTTMDDDFQGYNLDLRGLQGSAGLAFRL